MQHKNFLSKEEIKKIELAIFAIFLLAAGIMIGGIYMLFQSDRYCASSSSEHNWVEGFKDYGTKP